MPRLKWSPHSLRDMVRLYDFLAPKSRDAAKRAVKAIRQGVKLLGKNPEMGRPVEDLPEEFREWVIEFGSGAYVVLYRYDRREIVILAFATGARRNTETREYFSKCRYDHRANWDMGVKP